MTPEGKEAIRRELAEYILGTAAEWMRLPDLHVDPATGRITPEDDHQYRVSWEFPTDDAAVITVMEMDHTEVARFGVTITVETLPDLPPIGPENDLGIYGIGPEDEALKEWDPDYPGCAPEECGGSRLDPCSTVMRTKGARHDGDDWVNAGAVSCLACKGQGCEKCQNVGMWREADGPITLKPRDVVQPTWKPATFGDLLPGDRARIGQEETTVTRVSRDQWHAKDRQWVDDNGKVRDHMTPWEHEELRIDFTVNPGMKVYPPDVECEILCDAERAALLLLQRGFPNSTVVS